MGDAEIAMLLEAVEYYRDSGADPGYQGVFEQRYCSAFAEYMGGGSADAVATGTAALFVALAALELPQGSDVLVSPVTDPGTLSAIILNRLRPKLMDSAPGSFNVDVRSVESRIDSRTSAVVIVHNFGRAVEMPAVMDVARRAGIPVVEDCSQSHGARVAGQPVGSFGDIAAFSTMYRKIHMTGASGGVVFSRDVDLFHRATAHADRGKPRWQEDFDDRDPRGYLFPALNLHTDELSCAIGIASLARLDETIARRQEFVLGVAEGLRDRSGLFRSWLMGHDDAPFVAPIISSPPLERDAKIDFALRLRDRGVDLNPHYRYLVEDWPWVREHLADDFVTGNARDVIDASYFLYLNENYGQGQVDFVLDAILAEEALLDR